MGGRKTLIAAGSVVGAVLGGAIDPEAALPSGIVAGFLIWLLTWRAKEPVGSDRSLGFGTPVKPSSRPLAPPPVAVSPPSMPERSVRAEQAELKHLEYAAGVVTEAVRRGLVDRETADRLRALIEERRHRAMRAALAPAAELPVVPVLSAPPAPPPTPVTITVPERVPAPRPSVVQARAHRIKELVASDVAVHGLAYLGVLLLFAGAFGFTLFSFSTVRVGLRPVAEIGMPGMLLGSAWFLRRRGAPIVATGLGLIGGLLLPMMLFASFVDGVAFPPEVHGTALVLTLAAVATALAAAYAIYTVRQPGASLRYLVAPMVWCACWAAGLLLAEGASAGIDLRRWSAGQLAFVSVGVAATAAVPRLWPRLGLSRSIRISSVPGIAVAYALAIALAAAEGWPASPVIVAGLAALVTVELLAGPAAGHVPVALLQAAILGITASALMPALGYATGGAVTAFAYLALLEWQEVRRRGAIPRAVSGIGVAAGLGLSVAGAWASVAAFGGVTVWAHVRRAIRFSSATLGEAWALEAGAALLPVGAAWGLLQVWPDGRALMALAGIPLAAAVTVRVLRRHDLFYAWWVPAAAGSVIAATVVVRSAEPAEQLAAAAGLCALAIALSPRWPAARVWATAAALAWTVELTFDAADAALRYRTMVWSGAGLALVVVASTRRRSRVAGHLAAVGTALALAGLGAAPTELARLVTLALWAAMWLVTVVDQERGGAPVVDLILRALRGMLPRGVERVIAAVRAAILLTSLPFLATAAGRHVGPIADHRSWSALVVVGVGALTPWSVLELPWTGGIWATGLVASWLLLAQMKGSRDPWVRWDLAPLVVAHGVAAVALARSLDVGAVAATWSGIGALWLALAGLRRNPFWAGAGAIVLGVGAGAGGPGWLALALAAYSLVAVGVAIRSRGLFRLAMQATSMALAAASWSQLALWAGWSGPRAAMLTACLSATVAVLTGAAARWARLPADWAANLAALSGAGALAVGGLIFAPSAGLDPHTGAVLMALVTASLSLGAGLAARPLAVHALRGASALLAAGSGLLLGYGREVEPGPLTGWWAAT